MLGGYLGMDRLVFFIAIAGALFSSYFLYLQVFVIKALCVYCLGSAAVSYLLGLMTWIKTHTPASPSQIAS